MENKISLIKVVDELKDITEKGVRGWNWDEAIPNFDGNKFQIGDEYFEYNLKIGYQAGRTLIDSLLDLIVEEDHIEHAMKEAYTMLVVIAACTNIDVTVMASNIDEVANLPFNEGALMIMDFLKYQDEYDYVSSLLYEADMRITQVQNRLNRETKLGAVADRIATMLDELAGKIKPEDIEDIMNVVNKLKNVEQKDIVDEVIKIQREREEK